MSRQHRLAALATSVLGAIGFAAAVAAPAAAATPACGTTTTTDYSATLCITAPADGDTLTGAVPVTATVQTSGSPPVVNGIQYTIDGQDLLFDFQSPYSFLLHTNYLAAGQHQLTAQIAFSGGTYSDPLSITVTVTPQTPPTIPSFTPRTGTDPGAGQPFVMAVAGDGATGLTAEKQITAMIASWNPNLVGYLGDVYKDGTTEEFLNWYGSDGTFYDRFRSITDPTPGNHEYDSGEDAGYTDYWGQVPDYYSVTTHGWHIISLDDAVNNGQDATSSPQYQWLVNDLSTNTAPCVLVEWHRPVYSLNPDEQATNFAAYWQLFNQHHVAINVAGHSHNYQRWKPLDANGNPDPNGVTEFVVGTGGNWISPFTSTDSRVAAGFDTTATAWGALRLNLNATGATYQFTDINGVTRDSGSVTCGSSADTSPPSAPSGLTAQAVNGREVDLSWQPSSDNVGVSAYRVLRNGSLVGTVDGTTTTFADTTVDASTTYTYSIVATDAAGNVSPPSGTASASTPAPTPLYVQSAALSTGSRVSSTTLALPSAVRQNDVLVGWFAQYDASGQVAVSDNVNGAWTRVQGMSYGSSAGDTALYYVRSAAAPNGVTVSVSAGSATYVQAAVGDYWGVAGTGPPLLTSRIAKGNGTAVASGPTAAVPAGSLVFTGLLTGGAPGTVSPGSSAGVPLVLRSHNATFAALSADVTSSAAGAQQGSFTLGNATDWHAGVAVLAGAAGADTSSPTTPTGVTATAAAGPVVTVAWHAATDNIGVTGYSVYRGGTLLGDTNSAQLSYSDTTVAAGTTYSYTVVAYDEAGNRSPPSAPASVTTGQNSPSYVQGGIATTGGRALSTTLKMTRAVHRGDVLVGWFGQYDAPGQVQVSDNVFGPWQRIQGETFANGGGDVGMYYVRATGDAPSGVTVTASAGAATWLEASAADYGGAATPGNLVSSAVASGRGTAADSGLTAAASGGALVITAVITGGNPGGATPGPTAGQTPTIRAANGSGSVTIADVLNASAGAQHGAFTLGTATDWYAACAVFGP